MKSLFKNLLLLSTMVSLVFLFSCGDDDPEDVVIGPPSLSVSASSSVYTPDDTISFDVTYDVPGEFGGFNYSWTASDGETVVSFDKQFLSPSQLDGVVQSETSGSFTFKPFDDVKIGGLDLILNSEPYELAGKDLEFKFEIVNASEDAQVDSTTVAVSVESNIEVYEQLLFGAQGNTEPGFYGVTQNTLYTWAQARDNSADVDFAYYWGDANESTIAAIDDGGLNAVYEATNATLSIEDNFATRNSTLFVETDLTATQYEEVNTKTELEAQAFFEVGGTSNATQLAVDDILAYKLADSRGGIFGLIRVISIDDTNGNGTITIEVKAPIAE